MRRITCGTPILEGTTVVTSPPKDNRTNVAGRIRDELLTIGIPPRPAVLESIELEMGRAAPNYASLEKIISHDVGVSASLLKIANSAFFGFSGKISTVQDALQVLGLNTVASAIAAFSLRQAFAHVPNMERFWDASARTAQISGWLASHVAVTKGKIRPDVAYTFGLFRDCGIPILRANFLDYLDILRVANKEADVSFTAIEEEELGVNHAQIGAKLAKEWRLPIEFHSAIEAHHNVSAISGITAVPLSPHAQYFIALAQLSELMLQRLTGLNMTKEWGKLGEACMEVLQLTEVDIEQLQQEIHASGVHAEAIG